MANKKYTKSETSKRFQGTPSTVKAKMKRDPKFAEGMKEHYGVSETDFKGWKRAKNQYKEGK